MIIQFAFNYLNEKTFSEILKDTGYTILEIHITGDARTNRATEQWLDIVMKKMNRQQVC